jgi:hypothetical protein
MRGRPRSPTVRASMSSQDHREPPDETLDEVVLRTIAQLRPEIDEDELPLALRDVARSTAESIVDELRERAAAMLIDHAAVRTSFEIRLRDPWAPAFDRYEALLVSALEMGELFAKRHAAEADREGAGGDRLFDAMVRLHARAVLIADEVFSLLRSGHAAGALARWRTLHEVAVVMAFLAKGGPALAERYLLHDTIARWRALDDDQLFAERLGEEPFGAEEIDDMRSQRDRLVERFGSAYGEAWGWAADALRKRRPTFRDIEQAADLAHWRPYRRWASQNVHAGPHAILDVMGAGDAEGMLLAGASDMDLVRPGANASLSLALATVELLATRVGLDELVSVRVIMTLSREANEAFWAAHGELETRVAEERRRERRTRRRRRQRRRSGPRRD